MRQSQYHLFWHPGFHRPLHYDPLQKEEEGMATQVIIVIQIIVIMILISRLIVIYLSVIISIIMILICYVESLVTKIPNKSFMCFQKTAQ